MKRTARTLFTIAAAAAFAGCLPDAPTTPTPGNDDTPDFSAYDGVWKVTVTETVTTGEPPLETTTITNIEEIVHINVEGDSLILRQCGEFAGQTLTYNAAETRFELAENDENDPLPHVQLDESNGLSLSISLGNTEISGTAASYAGGNSVGTFNAWEAGGMESLLLGGEIVDLDCYRIETVESESVTTNPHFELAGSLEDSTKRLHIIVGTDMAFLTINEVSETATAQRLHTDDPGRIQLPSYNLSASTLSTEIYSELSDQNGDLFIHGLATINR